MGLTNGMTGGAIFKDKTKAEALTSNDSTDKFSVTFQAKQRSPMPMEQIPLPSEAPTESLPPTPTAPTLSSENVEKILKELQKLQRADAELMRKQELIPQEIEQQLQASLKSLTAEAAQSYDEYLKTITLQRVKDAEVKLRRLDALGAEYEKRICFSQRLKKACVALLIANASLLTLIILISLLTK